MAEVLVRYVAKMFGKDGTEYAARACGGIADDGLWEGWIEFISGDRSVRTGRETEQPNRDALIYWAEGLTVAYLEGALVRATAAPRVLVPRDVAAKPRFERPARLTAPRGFKAVRAILDPYITFDQGEDILRGQLNALSHDNLVAIVEDYALPVRGVADMSARRLVDAIIEAVRARTNEVAGARPVAEATRELGEERRP